MFHKSPTHHHFVAGEGLLVAAASNKLDFRPESFLLYLEKCDAPVNGIPDCFMTLLPVIVMFKEIYCGGGGVTAFLFYSRPVLCAAAYRNKDREIKKR